MKEYEGLIGIVIGVVLGYLLPVITAKWNKRKSLYVDVPKLYFSYPIFPQDSLISKFSIYVYNDSVLPKVFMIQTLQHEASGDFFYLEQQTDVDGVYSRPRVQQINPLTAENLKFKASMDPDTDFDVPNIGNSPAAILTYRTGKTIKKLNVQLEYYNPI